MNIQGKRIVLRAIEVADLPHLHAWSNSPEIARDLGDVHFPSSLHQQEKWYERSQQDETNIRLAVQERAGRLIGYTGLWRIHWRDRRAEHALFVGEPTFRGRGFGREIISTCARYAFEEMGLARLDAAILETNAASRKAYEASGFQVEGNLRAHAFRHGKWVNRLLLGILSSDYQEWVKQTQYWEKVSEQL